MREKIRRTMAAASVAAGIAASAGADVVTDWNEILVDAVRSERTNPPVATRKMAMMHTAVYDAVNGIVRTHEPYHVAPAAPDGASPEAAAAAAAHRVLSAVFPAQAATFDAALAASLAELPAGVATADGVAWGEACADAIIDLRAADGSSGTVDYYLPEGSGWWAPTGPAYAPALLPNWPYVTPWAMTSGSQFRVAAPPPLTSAQYAQDYHEVYHLGRATDSERTADQSEIARFWNDGPGTSTPPGHWLWIAGILAEQQGTSLAENARLFALLSITVADAAIVSWDNKYFYNNWRPATGIHLADYDGRPDTHKDPSWESYIGTPPFPTYTSGHSTFSGGSARLLRHVFGTDALAFTVGSDGTPGVERSYDSLSEAAEEAGQSRIYGGIHWQYDNQGGLSSGRALADYVYFSRLRRLGAAGTVCDPDATTLCLAGGRFEVRARWADELGSSGQANAEAQSDESGSFWFFDAQNTEITVKVLDGCAETPPGYWVFAAAMTNVEVTLTVTDTMTGALRAYHNPQGQRFAPVQDTSAFATCP